MEFLNYSEEALENCTLREAAAKFGSDALPLWHSVIYNRPFKLESRRYIGCKAKLVDWIFDIIKREAKDAQSFCDIFAGTGSVSNRALQHYKDVIINDFLYSNQVLYTAFFANENWNKQKVFDYLDAFNNIDPDVVKSNYFSENYGGKYFDELSAKMIGHTRDVIEDIRVTLNNKEYCILLASLIYSIDKITNTLGHFEAYIKRPIEPRKFVLRPVDAHCFEGAKIFREDANQLARKIKTDIVYLDPPYNSRQYSRFYHVYEVLVKWDKPKLQGDARKPPQENMSDYCRVKALEKFTDLVANIDARYIAVSYNNTYNSKSSSSENKIKLEEIEEVLNKCGDTKVFTHSYNPFNAGKTDFADHKEYLFVTKVDNEKRNSSFASLLRG